MSNYTKKSRSRFRSTATFVLILYIVFLFWLLLLKGDLDHISILAKIDLLHPHNANLKLGATIKLMWDALDDRYYGNWAILNLFGNVAACIPLGLFWPLATNQCYTFAKTMFGSLIVISIIETAQYYTGLGVFDVDDFVLNLLGALLGWVFYKITSLVLSRRKHRTNYRKSS